MRPAASSSSGRASCIRTRSAALVVPGGRLGGSGDRRGDPRRDGARAIDYYVLRPAAAADEVFHQAISGFLLEWATERRLVPHTIHIVGEEWSGRAYELREVFERCAVPHTFCLAESEQGRELLAGGGRDATLPVMVLPDGRALSDPSNAEIAEAAGRAGRARGARLRRRHRRRRAGRPVGGGLRRLRGPAHARRRRGRHRRPGHGRAR